MIKARRKNTTELKELVETHNLILSLQRLQTGPYDRSRLGRALYHALCVAGEYGLAEVVRVKAALP